MTTEDKPGDVIVTTQSGLPDGLCKVTNLTTGEAIVTESRADKVEKATQNLRTT